MAEEQRPRILYFKEFIPTSVCILLSLFFAMVFQFNGGVFSSYVCTDVKCIGLPERRCDDGGICLIHRYDSDFSHSVSSEVSLYYPTDIYDGMSGTYLLQPGDDARAEYLHTGRNVLYFRFFQNVGYI